MSEPTPAPADPPGGRHAGTRLPLEADSLAIAAAVTGLTALPLLLSHWVFTGATDDLLDRLAWPLLLLGLALAGWWLVRRRGFRWWWPLASLLVFELLVLAVDGHVGYRVHDLRFLPLVAPVVAGVVSLPRRGGVKSAVRIVLPVLALTLALSLLAGQGMTQVQRERRIIALQGWVQAWYLPDTSDRLHFVRQEPSGASYLWRREGEGIVIELRNPGTASFCGRPDSVDACHAVAGDALVRMGDRGTEVIKVFPDAQVRLSSASPHALDEQTLMAALAQMKKMDARMVDKRTG